VKLNDYLNVLQSFLENNFYQSQQIEGSDTLYIFRTEETSYENEAFLAELQLVSMDAEKAYQNYHTAVIRLLQI
jgi:hypothetical protein